MIKWNENYNNIASLATGNKYAICVVANIVDTDDVTVETIDKCMLNLWFDHYSKQQKRETENPENSGVRVRVECKRLKLLTKHRIFIVNSLLRPKNTNVFVYTISLISFMQ